MSDEELLEKEEDKRRYRLLRTFETCTTCEELKAAAMVQSNIIKALSAEDREWLRCAYVSRMGTLKDKENPKDLYKYLKGGKDVASRKRCDD